MEFSVNDRVYLRHTGEQGTITSNIGGGMFNVRLDSDPDFEIPAFADDMQALIAGQTLKKPSKSNQKEKDFAHSQPVYRSVQVQYIILKPKGLQLGFEPILNSEGIPSKYDVWLLNDTQHELAVEADLFVLNEQVLMLRELIKPLSALRMGVMIADDLNDAPELELLCQRVTTAGLSHGVEKVVRIKAKQFFKNLNTAPILNKQLHLFKLVEAEKILQDDDKNVDSTQNDLTDYTKQKVKENESEKKQNEPYSTRYNAYDVGAFVDFPTEIDLHIQSLMNGYASIDKSEILRIQLKHFDQYMQKAIRLGVHRVFIIHGVGQGKLKDTIAKKLKTYPDVRKFKNEFHPKYGYGATEVIFEW